MSWGGVVKLYHDDFHTLQNDIASVRLMEGSQALLVIEEESESESGDKDKDKSDSSISISSSISSSTGSAGASFGQKTEKEKEKDSLDPIKRDSSNNVKSVGFELDVDGGIDLDDLDMDMPGMGLGLQLGGVGDKGGCTVTRGPAVRQMHRFPPTNLTHHINAAGVRTDIQCTSFDDHHFVLITQIKKFGTVIKVWKDEVTGGGAFGKPAYQQQTMLGKRDDPLLNVYVLMLIELWDICL